MLSDLIDLDSTQDIVKHSIYMEVTKPGACSGYIKEGDTSYSVNRQENYGKRGNSYSANSNRRESNNKITKKMYLKAMFMIDKVERNAIEGRFHHRDEADKIRYEDIVAKYRSQQAYMNFSDKSKSPKPTKRSYSIDNTSIESPAMIKKVRPETTVLTTGTMMVRDHSQQTTKNIFNSDFVVLDHLQLAIVDEFAPKGQISADLWTKIESRLTELIMDYVLVNEDGLLPSFDFSPETSKVYRVIRCDNEFPKNFLYKIVDSISDKWAGSKIKLISSNDMPQGPRARIWLPKLEIDAHKLLMCLKLQNPKIPTENWMVLKKESSQNCCQSFLLMINEECIGPLSRNDNTVRFGIRQVKLEIFEAGTPIDDAVDDEPTNDVITNMP